MDLNYNIKIYPAAERDLLEIIEYLNTLSQKVALISKGYRYLIVRDYLVFYKVIGGTVEIQRSLYGRRNYQALL